MNCACVATAVEHRAFNWSAARRLLKITRFEKATAKLQFNNDTRFREREALAEAARYPAIEALARMKD